MRKQKQKSELTLSDSHSQEVVKLRCEPGSWLHVQGVPILLELSFTVYKAPLECHDL
jgi:hypothetical protein